MRRRRFDRARAIAVVCAVLAWAWLGLPSHATENRISGEILIELNPGVTIETVVDGYGLELVDAIPRWRFYNLKVSEGQDVDALVSQLKDDPRVDRAEPHRVLETPEGEQMSIPDLDFASTLDVFQDQPAAATINVEPALERFTGGGMIVAVLDTGIEFGHPALGDSVVTPGADFANGDGSGQAQGNGVDDDGDGLVDESSHHGTFVAALIHLTAPDARILPVRVLEADGRGTSFGVAKGILFAMERGADVINLSLSMLIDSRPVERAIELARDQGIVVVAAVGNRGIGRVDFPADLPDTIAVAAADAAGARAPFSNYGAEVDLSAPGVDLLSAFGVDYFANWSGTSFAAPLVSGGTALILQKYPGLDTDDVRAVLQQTAAPDGNPPAFAGLMGAGILDLDALTQALTSDRTSLKLRRTPSGTVLDWSPVLGASGYDVARGEVGNLSAVGYDGETIDLGPLECLADDITDNGTATLPDDEIPLQGKAFFYVFRDDAPDPGGGYGTGDDGAPRIVPASDCP